MGAWSTARHPNGGREGEGRLPAGNDFEDLQVLAVADDLGDRDRRGAAEHDDRVGPFPVGAQDLFDRRARSRKLDAPGRLVEPSADGNFGRNPSFLRGGKRLKRKLDFKASPARPARLLAEVA